MLISGRVQGVFFRRYASDHAKRLGVRGFVRNLSSGNTVEAVAQGPEASVKEFLELLKKGPPNAVVEQVSSESIDNEPLYEDFSIK